MSENRKPGPSVETVPDGDDRVRLVCPECGYIEYRNPKVVVGAVCVWEDRFLLCRRDIEPRRGYWTMPAGYLELNETTAAGAAREAWEEARVRVEVTGLIGVYELPHISQVYVIHKAAMLSPDYAAGPESQDVCLFAWQDLPWDELAFPSVAWAHRRYHAGDPPDVHVHERGSPAGGL